MEDKFKKTEAVLYRYKDIDKLNKLADLKIKKLLNDVSLGGGDMFGEKSSPTNQFHSTVENDVIDRENREIDKQINQLRKEKENRIIEKELIDAAMKELLEEEERQLINIRYFTPGKIPPKWDIIASRMNLGRDTCIKMRREIIYKLSQWI